MMLGMQCEFSGNSAGHVKRLKSIKLKAQKIRMKLKILRTSSGFYYKLLSVKGGGILALEVHEGPSIGFQSHWSCVT